MTASPVVSVLLPAALVFIMVYLGLTLRGEDFARVARQPRALAVGLAGQLLLVPALGWAVARGWPMDPLMAVGLVVLAACPGGVSAGLLTHLARGDVALSIVLTAVTSLVAMLTLPLWVDAALRHFTDQGLAVTLPLGDTVRRVFLLTCVPVLAGMALRHWRGPQVQRFEAAAGRIATGLFVLIVLATFWSQREVLLRHLPTIGPATLVLNALILAGAWALSRASGLQRRDAIAVATECGLQNSALGIYVCLTLLQSPAMSVPSVVYALLMNAGGLAFVALMRRATPGRLGTRLGAEA